MIENPRIPLTSIHRIEADGVSVFYRQAGPADAPIVLLLHGFPTSSFQYRELIPRLGDRYRVIAPDLPGFGFTVVPEERRYKRGMERAKSPLRLGDAPPLMRDQPVQHIAAGTSGKTLKSWHGAPPSSPGTSM